MWASLRRLFGRPVRPDRPARRDQSARRGPRHQAGRAYRSRAYLPLQPWQVRGRRFSTARRGLDAGEVTAYLDWVADDLAHLYTELARSQDETMRVKDALRQWQSRQAPSMRELARR
ncbi:DivIVA domain-containing protein [Micromonospora sp. NPDC003197]